MATKATIHKALLNIANMDTNYYNEHNLTLALHPSETEQRLMARVIAFVLNANEDLGFCKGISEDDEPDLWEKDFDGTIKLWIDLGQPDEKRIKKACGRANKVIIYTYQENMATPWFKQIENNLSRFKNLSIIHLNIEDDLEELAKRSMVLQCNISDEELTLISDNKDCIITQKVWK
ncbi:MAG: YaeQ family protein [Aliarcobacter sp.]|nr:YaeQ family protein [Aliarcobacter sp.]